MHAMLPRPRARIPGTTAWLSSSTPRRFTSSTASHCAGPISMNFSGCVIPALLIRMSMAPIPATTRPTASAHAAASVTSHANPRCPGPIPAAAASAAPASRSRIATRAPCSANNLAVASPIPRALAAPEITATLPSNNIPLPQDFLLAWDPAPAPPRHAKDKFAR